MSHTLPRIKTTSETTPTAMTRMMLRAMRKKAFFAAVQKLYPKMAVCM